MQQQGQNYLAFHGGGLGFDSQPNPYGHMMRGWYEKMKKMILSR
jgi:hypothetical protein